MYALLVGWFIVVCLITFLWLLMKLLCSLWLSLLCVYAVGYFSLVTCFCWVVLNLCFLVFVIWFVLFPGLSLVIVTCFFDFVGWLLFLTLFAVGFETVRWVAWFFVFGLGVCFIGFGCRCCWLCWLIVPGYCWLLSFDLFWFWLNCF